MKSTPPRSAKFLLSDDIREEANGKMTIVGLYADDRIFLSPPPPGTIYPTGVVGAMNQLCVSCVMFGGVGDIPTTAEVTDPNGLQFAMAMTVQSFKHGSASTLAIKGGSVAVPAFGTYKCTVTVAPSRVFLYSFEILLGPAPSLLPAAAVPVPAAPKRSAPTRRSRRHK